MMMMIGIVFFFCFLPFSNFYYCYYSSEQYIKTQFYRIYNMIGYDDAYDDCICDDDDDDGDECDNFAIQM